MSVYEFNFVCDIYDMYPNYGFLGTISFLSVVLNLVPISREYNNALYSVNWICFIGFVIMVLLNPHGFFELYGSTFQHIGNTLIRGLGDIVSEPVFYLGAILFHAAPILAFRNTYSLGQAMWPMLAYLVVFGPYLERIYPLESWKVVGIGIAGIVGVELVR